MTRALGVWTSENRASPLADKAGEVAKLKADVGVSAVEKKAARAAEYA